MTPEEEVSKGARYQELKEHFDEILGNMKESISNQMDAVPMTQVDMHSKLILTKQLLGAIDKHINTVIDTGKLAAFQLDRSREKKIF